jgi:putative spermidine/putrescine transport system ATP-binding protein
VELVSLRRELNTPMVYVTHDQAEALSLSDRVVVMRDGRVMQAGTPVEIHDRPANLFVADFMGYRNFFPVTIAGVAENGTVLGRAGALQLAGRGTVSTAHGAGAVVAVRPEDLALTEDPPGVNVLWGRVRLVEYLGREHDLEVALPSGQVVKARVPQAVPVGTLVGLRFPPDRGVVLGAQDGSGGTR